MSFVLAHISDLHVPPLPKPLPTELAGKRLLSWLSWHWKRKGIHRAEVLEALLSDLSDQAPDHIALTGDLVNLSLPAEFRQSAGVLERLGPPARVSLVPGNHDRLVSLKWETSWQHWDDYLRSDEQGDAAQDFDSIFPTLHRRGPLALVGVSTAIATPPTFASGRIGRSQLERMEALLTALAAEGATVIILLHHGPLPGQNKRRKRLQDSAAFREVLLRYGAALVLHGHDHRFVEGHLPGPRGAIPVLGVASGTALAWQNRPAAHYHLLSFDGRRQASQVQLSVRAYDPSAGRFTIRNSRTLALPDGLR